MLTIIRLSSVPSLIMRLFLPPTTLLPHSFHLLCVPMLNLKVHSLVLPPHPPADLKVGEAVSVLADVNGSCHKGQCSKFEGEVVFVGNGVARKSRAEVFRRDGSAAR